MLSILKSWYQRHFSDPRTIMLLFTLLAIFSVILLAGNMLAPVIASLVIAYLLEGLVRLFMERGIGRTIAVSMVFSLFILFVIFVFLIPVPQLFNQAKELGSELPLILSKIQNLLLRLPQEYPDFFTEQQVRELIGGLQADITALGKNIVSWSLSSVVGAVTVVVYIILVPLLVFFFLKDKDNIMQWFGRYLPGDHSLAVRVWDDVDQQAGNYVRGKFIEIIIIGAVCLATFTTFGLNFSLLLAALVGLSVIIPYIGAAVVTLPVVSVAYFQWGLDGYFYWVVLSYLVIQILDGNVLVPLLFSEVVNLHPIAIIIAILIFGGIWGIWGVFFAIPLATLVQAILNAWPVPDEVATA